MQLFLYSQALAEKEEKVRVFLTEIVSFQGKVFSERECDNRPHVSSARFVRMFHPRVFVRLRHDAFSAFSA